MSYLDGLIVFLSAFSLLLAGRFIVGRYLGPRPFNRFFKGLDTATLVRQLSDATPDTGPVKPAFRYPVGTPLRDVEKELLSKNSALLRANRSLVQSRTQLRRLVEKLYDIKEKEGVRVARELHDELGQILTGLKIEVSLLDRRIQKQKADDRAAAELVEETLGLVDQSILRVQTLSKELRPPMLDKLGLIATFEAVTKEIARQTGVECRMSHQVFEERLSAEVLTYAYRVFKETLSALANQPEVELISVRVETHDDNIAIRIADDCRSPAALFDDDGSVGVLGMTEYARKYGGTFTLISNAGSGTVVNIVLPMVI